MTAAIKDLRPKMRGSARAFAAMQRQLQLQHRVMADGSRGAPMIHQADGLACMLDRLERFSSFGLLHDMGCGKTLTMIALLLVLAEEDRAEKMFVACPSSVIGSWQREVGEVNRCRAAAGDNRPALEFMALDQAGVPKRIRALEECLAARDARRAAGEQLPPLIVAGNYEGVWRMEKELRAARFDIDAADESQRIKAPGSKQSLAMYRLGRISAFRVLMTGTPVPEGGLDWYGQWRFADPQLLGTNHGDFKARFALEIPCETRDGKQFRKVIVNPHTKHLLEEAVFERVHRVSKEEALDLPEQSDAIIEVQLTPRQRRIYDDLVADSIAFIDRGEFTGATSGPDNSFGEVIGDNPLTRMLRCLQVCGGWMQLHGDAAVIPCDPKDNPKLRALEELAETLRDAGAPLVVFYRFAHEGEEIIRKLQRLAGKARPVSQIHGAITTADRGRMVGAFQDGDTPFFVGQIQACSEGITLHAAADLAHYSMPFGSAPYLQGNSRVHRIGQFRPVTIHHLLAERTVDVSLYHSQQDKRDASIDAVDGAWGRFLQGEL